MGRAERDRRRSVGRCRAARCQIRRVGRVALARGDALRRQIDRAQEDGGAQEREFGLEVALGNVSPPTTTAAVRPVGPAVAARLQQILAIEGRIDGEDADRRFAGVGEKRRQRRLALGAETARTEGEATLGNRQSHDERRRTGRAPISR